jgi:hypothetical protein
LPLLPRAIHVPAAWNSPSSSHRLANTSMAARNPTTGSIRPTSAVASAVDTAPTATTTTAAGTATTASDRPAGRAMAKTSTTASATRATISTGRSGPRVGALPDGGQV